jgi:hypothetical protein
MLTIRIHHLIFLGWQIREAMRYTERIGKINTYILFENLKIILIEISWVNLINSLNYIGNCMKTHHLLQHSVTLHLTHRAYVQVSYNSQSKLIISINSIDQLIFAYCVQISRWDNSVWTGRANLLLPGVKFTSKVANYKWYQPQFCISHLPMRTACLAHLIPFDLMILIMFGEE